MDRFPEGRAVGWIPDWWQRTPSLLIRSGVLTLLGIAFAPQMVHQWAVGFEQVPGKAELTVQLTRIMMPFLLAMPNTLTNPTIDPRDSTPPLSSA